LIREQIPFPVVLIAGGEAGGGGEAGAGTMDPYQWFFLGMMVAWTPGLVALALILSRAEDPDPQQR
jgi:hypothetical protein